jgi:hypothetical protein
MFDNEPGQTGDLLPVTGESTVSDTQLPATGESGGRNNRPLIISVVALVALLAIFAGVMGVHALAASSPSDILANAKKASLKDASFDIQGQVGLNLGDQAGSTPATTSISGKGVMTLTPAARNDVTLTVSLLGPQSKFEILTDSNTLYAQFGGLSSLGISSDGKWIKVANPSQEKPKTILDSYDYLHNTTLVGSETINGHDTWHIKGSLTATTSSSSNATATAVASKTGIKASGTATEDLWVTKDHYYPAKIQVHVSGNADLGDLSSSLSGLGDLGGLGINAPSTTGLTLDATINFTAWNSGASVTVPAASDVIDPSDMMKLLPPSTTLVPGM